MFPNLLNDPQGSFHTQIYNQGVEIERVKMRNLDLMVNIADLYEKYIHVSQQLELLLKEKQS